MAFKVIGMFYFRTLPRLIWTNNIETSSKLLKPNTLLPFLFILRIQFPFSIFYLFGTDQYLGLIYAFLSFLSCNQNFLSFLRLTNVVLSRMTFVLQQLSSLFLSYTNQLTVEWPKHYWPYLNWFSFYLLLLDLLFYHPDHFHFFDQDKLVFRFSIIFA